jgi:glycosyltransferase involved in cell wall biosynthesis
MPAVIESLNGKRVALVHHWLLSMRGGERVLEAVARLISDAPIFTLLARPTELSEALQSRDIRTSFLDRLPGARNHHRNFLPLYPLAARSLDCRGYDVVIISDAALVKGVRTDPGALVLCYCHSPMRSIWELTDAYAAQLGLLRGTALRCVSHRLRDWDRRAARRVDHFAANSRFVQDRIRRCYARDSEVIYPPVRVPPVCPERQPEDFYLMVGELAEYKRTDLGVAACAKLRRRLKVIGDGPQMRRLRRLADSNVELLGRATDEEIRHHLSRCRALLFCAEEDFGIVPVEAMAAGCPVIAYARGGACETVLDGRTGLLFGQQTVESVADAIQRFEADAESFDPAYLHARAKQFSNEAFAANFRVWVDRTAGRR